MARAAGGVPWHLWAVGAVSAIWNAGGAYDYVMTNLHNAAYLAPFTAAERAYFLAFPAWVTGVWALGVWGALAGSLLLLLRNRFAVVAFVLALIGEAAMTLYQFTSHPPASLVRPSNLAFLAAIWIVTIALLAYALWMRRRRVLR